MGTGSQARGRRTCQSYALGRGASLTWSRRAGAAVFFIDAAARRRCPVRAIDWGAPLAAEGGPGEGHSNNLKCLMSGWKVFSCCAAAMIFAMDS